MATTGHTKLKLASVLNAANKHYPEKYLSEYFDTATGNSRAGSGDTLAQFIVSELSETFDAESTRELQVAAAVSVLLSAKREIQNAIDGLENLLRFSSHA